MCPSEIGAGNNVPLTCVLQHELLDAKRRDASH